MDDLSPDFRHRQHGFSEAGLSDLTGHSPNHAGCAILYNDLAAGSGKAVGEAYNLCNDGFITLEGYFNKIAAHIGAEPVTRKVPYKVVHAAAFLMEVFGHVLRRKSPPLVTRYSVWLMGRKCFFSTEKIRRDLGWEPAVGYDEGIARAVAWARANP